MGDAACGKPFYLGSNLNAHFQDTISLLPLGFNDVREISLRSCPWSSWPTPGEAPFKCGSEKSERRASEVIRGTISEAD